MLSKIFKTTFKHKLYKKLFFALQDFDSENVYNVVLKNLISRVILQYNVKGLTMHRDESGSVEPTCNLFNNNNKKKPLMKKSLFNIKPSQTT